MFQLHWKPYIIYWNLSVVISLDCYIRWLETSSWFGDYFRTWFSIEEQGKDKYLSMWPNKPIRLGDTSWFDTNTCHQNKKLDQMWKRLPLFWDFSKFPINECNDLGINLYWFLKSHHTYHRGLWTVLFIQKDVVKWTKFLFRSGLVFTGFPTSQVLPILQHVSLGAWTAQSS